MLYPDRPAGAQVTAVDGAGLVTIQFSYRDNGRGPDLQEQVRMGADGVPERVTVDGTSAFGAPVRETFVRRDGRAEWKSLVDAGQAPAPAPTVYLPVECSPGMHAVIAQAISRQPDRRIAALPGGELKLERLAEAALEDAGRRVAVALHAITGLSTEPYFISRWRSCSRRPRTNRPRSPDWST